MKIYSPNGKNRFLEVETRREELEILVRQKYKEHSKEIMKRYPQVSEVINELEAPLKQSA